MQLRPLQAEGAPVAPLLQGIILEVPDDKGDGQNEDRHFQAGEDQGRARQQQPGSGGGQCLGNQPLAEPLAEGFNEGRAIGKRRERRKNCARGLKCLSNTEQDHHSVGKQLFIGPSVSEIEGAEFTRIVGLALRLGGLDQIDVARIGNAQRTADFFCQTYEEHPFARQADDHEAEEGIKTCAQGVSELSAKRQLFDFLFTQGRAASSGDDLGRERGHLADSRTA